jgi:hypothetical protein
MTEKEVVWRREGGQTISQIFVSSFMNVFVMKEISSLQAKFGTAHPEQTAS